MNSSSTHYLERTTITSRIDALRSRTKRERETVREKSIELFDQTCKESFDNWQSLMIKAGEEKRSNLNGLKDSELEGRKKGVVDGVCWNAYAKIDAPAAHLPSTSSTGIDKLFFDDDELHDELQLFKETVTDARKLFLTTMKDATRDIARAVAFQNSPAVASNFIN